jgi:hypothetical protein
MVDLTLASSYIPAFSCLAKSLATASLSYIVMPHGGLTAMCVAIQLDRIFFNTDFIVDVNAVVIAVIASFATNHERTHNGIMTPASMAMAVVWAKFAFLQLSRPIVKPRVELCVYAVLAVAMSCTHFSAEPLSYAIGRTAGFVLLVLLNVYWHTATSQEEPLALTSARYAYMLLGAPLVSVIGGLSVSLMLAYRWNTKPTTGSDPTPDMEAAHAAVALREALARSKEKCSQ